MLCTWTIVSDNPQSKVILTFTHIDIVYALYQNQLTKGTVNETNSVCSNELFYTIFRILDGPDPDAPEIIKFCKSNPIPPPIVSNGPAMRIEFTDNSDGLDSFVAMYSVRSTGQYKLNCVAFIAIRIIVHLTFFFFKCF